MARLFVLIAVMLAGQAVAVDGDYEIPYTDNYGYVYDPETGQFIQENGGQESSASISSTAGESLPMSHAENSQAMEEVSEATGGQSYYYLFIVGGIVMLGIFAFTFWSRRKKIM